MSILDKALAHQGECVSYAEGRRRDAALSLADMTPPAPRFVNLTPHAVVIHDDEGPVCQFSSQGEARVSATYAPVETRAGVALMRQTFGPVEGLPEPAPHTVYIVSALVRLACPERTDLASPGELVRDAEGRPIGCHGLVLTLPRL